ncbi:Fpg/Nei family DNA glycosylase [Streptomyces marincola]|uniref:Fpg/Nei family DNA glycosylase n=1 Tax=Streptomyces marincola TaxID=2878388 RepID=UPI001CF2CC92|nr:DNA-formamidopyrimidine glycosylase family protein [Streptomyces marincola]UCM88080.1 Fpg/Nei family DNA glycosylase [Streptomyces marincola]
MPEGHTVHRLAAAYGRTFGGRPVRALSPQGKFAASAALLDGQPMTASEAHGKHLFLGFGAVGWVHIHLGLYGKVAFGDGPAPPPVGQVRLRLAGPGGHADLRGPATCALVGDAEKEAVRDRLGPDPLREDADPERAWRRVSTARSPIAALLMDQSVVAGPGNIYRAEVLFRRGIGPYRPGRDLSRAEWDGIWADLVALMREGVRTGRIDTVRPEHTPEAMGRPPRRDDHGGEVYVYRRAGADCHVCGGEVRAAELAARNLFWCQGCQPHPPAPARAHAARAARAAG